MQTKNSHIQGILLTLLATFCWGAGTVLTKFALKNAQDGPTFFFVQLSSACLFMFFISLKYFKSRQGEIKYAWLGLLEPGLAYSLGVLGLYHASASQAAVVQALESLMIVGVSFVFWQDKTSLRVLLLGCIAIIGVSLVVMTDNSFDGLNIGIVWIALGTLVAAFYVTLSSKVIANNYNPFLLIFWQLFVATVFCGIFLLLYNPKFDIESELNIPIIASGIVTYALSFVLYLQGMRYISVSLSAFLLCLTPIFGVTLSLIFLGEQLTPINWMGFF
ncbi:MAG: DMT family transporter, partial [Formosimonas sp.]